MTDLSKFEDFLNRKRISSDSFRSSQEKEWLQYRSEFDLAGEAAFDARKKFYLNNLRLQFPLEETS